MPTVTQEKNRIFRASGSFNVGGPREVNIQDDHSAPPACVGLSGVVVLWACSHEPVPSLRRNSCVHKSRHPQRARGQNVECAVVVDVAERNCPDHRVVLRQALFDGAIALS